MKNSYEVLGVKPDSTDAEIKSAYRALVKKYHPDSYVDNPLSELAAEKMVEINAAFDDITETRKKNGGAGSNANNNTYDYNNSNSNAAGSGSNLNHIRAKIQANQITEAEEMLDKITLNSRDAEWYYLKGTIYYSRGWLDDAKNHFKTACNLNPNNVEYQSAYNRMNFQSAGGFSNGRTIPGGCCCYPCFPCCSCGDPCDMCQTLLCLDCCCECMGGDFISCC